LGPVGCSFQYSKVHFPNRDHERKHLLSALIKLHQGKANFLSKMKILIGQLVVSIFEHSFEEQQ
jgi:hypothetical protein